MVTQFGFVTIWSTAWPLAPLFTFINNIIELRSDAFKITHHARRPIPARTDTMGPWLESISFITWLGALNNTALLFLFHRPSTPLSSYAVLRPFLASQGARVTTALLLALASSHLYILFRTLIAHILSRALWINSPEEMKEAGVDGDVKGRWLKSVLEREGQIKVGGVNVELVEPEGGFWMDEGVGILRGDRKTS
jgi:anoctamin-10